MKAFTLLEIIFVIIVVGILSVSIIPAFQRDTLLEAATQVVSHIRYTQHLALVDDKFNPSDKEWFKGRWQIRFYKNLSFTNSTCPKESLKNIWAYTVFSDNPTYTKNPNIKEIAKNPLNSSELLSGGYNNTLCVDNAYNNKNSNSMKSLRLNSAYQVEEVKFSGGCRSDTRYINFDHLGRPFNSFPRSSSYELGKGGRVKLIVKRCVISLCSTACSVAKSDEKIDIAIEPETGYTHII